MPADPPHTPPPRKRRLPILVRHAISLGIVFVIALPLSYEIGRRVYRERQLDKLESTDRRTFEEGLSYVYRHLTTDDRVLDRTVRASAKLPPADAAELLLTAADGINASEGGAAKRSVITASAGELLKRLAPEQAVAFYDQFNQLDGFETRFLGEPLKAVLQTDDDARFMKLVELFDARLLWSKDLVTRDAWVRWLALLAESQDELTQHKSATLLGELPDDLGDPRIAQTLELLSRSGHDSVRAQVLKAAGGYAAIADDPVDYEQIIFALGGDTNKIIARRAWMIVGHLNPLSGYAVNWRDTDPFIAEAVLWASLKTNPDRTQPAIDALRTPGYAAAGALALSAWRHPYGVTDEDLALQEVIETRRDDTAVWRSILASQDYRNGGVTIIYPYGYKPQYELDQAHLHFAGSWSRAGYPPERDPARETYDFELLAYVEGQLDHTDWSGPFLPKAIDAETPILTRLLVAVRRPGQAVPINLESISRAAAEEKDLFVAAALKNAPLQERLLSDIDSRDRELAIASALLAGMTHSTPMLIDGITADVLRQHTGLIDEQLHAMSDTELAGIGLRRVDALTTLLDIAENAANAADRNHEIAMLKLALWMRGDLGEDFTPQAEAMLYDKDLPTSTVLMCLLHMKRPIALRYLFGDLFSPPPELQELFIQRRWWHVFRRFVDTSDLTLWLWGDPAAQDFQLKAMRQWYAVNRWRIERGWWPMAAEDQ